MIDRNQREQSIFTTQFINVFVAANPSLLIKYQNRNFVEPSGGIWAAFSFTSGKVNEAAVGGLVMRGIGALFLQVFFSENTGVLAAMTLVDNFSDAFMRQNFIYSDSISSGNIWTKQPQLSKGRLSLGWIPWTVSIDFQHDQFMDPVNSIP